MSDFPSSISEVENSLFNLWSEIGYTSTERECQQKEIEAQVVQLFQSFVEKTTIEKEKLQNEVLTSLENYNNLKQALGKQTEYVFNPNSPLRQQFNEINIAYNKLYKDSKDVITSFKKIHAEVSKNFEILGIPKNLRGEFESVGNKDLSSARYKRFSVKNDELVNEISSRTSKLADLKNKTSQLDKELEEKLPQNIQQFFDNEVITDNAFATIEKYIKDMEEEKNKRVEKLKTILSEIVKMWDLLDISKAERKEFTDSHTTIGINSIKDSESELKKLNALRAKQIPQLIISQQETIMQLAAYTHSKPEVDVTINPHEEECKEEVYGIYADEINRLEKLKESLDPILELIMQREVMQKEKDNLMKIFTQRGKGKTGTKYISPVENPKELMKEENDFRRVKCMIPRVERKLKIALLEYRAVNNHDFVLDGEAYINNLDHIKLNDLEVARAMVPHHKTRKSLAPSSLKDDLHEKAKSNLMRRRSENAMYVSNV